MKKLFIGLLTLTTLDAFACNSPVGGFCKGESVIHEFPYTLDGNNFHEETIRAQIIDFLSYQYAVTQDKFGKKRSVKIENLYKTTGCLPTYTSCVGDETILYIHDLYTHDGKMYEAKIEGVRQDGRLALSVAKDPFNSELSSGYQERSLVIKNGCSDVGGFCVGESVMYKNSSSQVKIIGFSKDGELAITESEDGLMKKREVKSVYKPTGCTPTGAYCVGDEAVLYNPSSRPLDNPRYHNLHEVKIIGVREDGLVMVLYINGGRFKNEIGAGWKESYLFMTNPLSDDRQL